MNKARAFAVHLLTASGAAFAFFALILAAKREWAAMFLMLGIALVVDGIDGPLARRLKVAETLPRWSGDTLDLVVDFLCYVFVPAYAIAASGYLPSGLAIPCGALVTITGALYFSDRNMKTGDNHFRGFPAVWNAAAFYLFLLQPAPWIAVAMVAILAALTFVPIHFVHPLRVRRLRALNIALLAVWSVLALAAIGRDLDPGFWVTTGLCTIAVYFFAAGLRRSPT